MATRRDVMVTGVLGAIGVSADAGASVDAIDAGTATAELQSPEAISAQALHSTLHANGSPIGLATVYRALGDLAANGEADSLQSPEGEALYRACSTTGHHHHLICRNCGLTVEIAADEVESWAKRVAAEHGFTGAAHVVDVFGLCANCTTALGADAR